MDKLNICIIGCGGIASRHAESLNRLGMNLYFASRDVSKASSYAKKFNAKGFFGNYQMAFKNPVIDAVVLCTPHDKHLEGVKMAAENKKHVLVEKPIATSLKEADEMIKIAKEAGITLMVAENFYFMPAVVKAKELIKDDSIGQLRFIMINQFLYHQVTGWRANKQQTGGGMFIDMGVHFANIVRNLGGKVKSVYAVKPMKTIRTEGEDAMFVLATLENGVVAEINDSWATRFVPKLQMSLISGTEGTIFMETSGLFILLWGKKKRFYFTGRKNGSGLLPMMHEFVSSINEKREPIISGEEGKKDLAFVLAAYESAKAKEH